jgi:hypothetical protein
MAQPRLGKMRDSGKPAAHMKITIALTNGPMRALVLNDAVPAPDARL